MASIAIYLILALVAALVVFLVWDTRHNAHHSTPSADAVPDAVSKKDIGELIRESIMQAAQDMKDSSQELMYDNFNPISHDKLTKWLNCELGPEDTAEMEKIFGCKVLKIEDRKDDAADEFEDEKREREYLEKVHNESFGEKSETFALTSDEVSTPYKGTRQETDYKAVRGEDGKVRAEVMALLDSLKNPARAEYLAERCGIEGYGADKEYTEAERSAIEAEKCNIRNYLDAQPMDEVIETLGSHILDSIAPASECPVKAEPISEELFSKRESTGGYTPVASTEKTLFDD